MTDLPSRLRALKIIDEVGSDNPLGRDAADEIERLQEALSDAMDLLSERDIADFICIHSAAAISARSPRQ